MLKSAKPKLLLMGIDEPLLASQAAIFTQHGYMLGKAHSEAELRGALAQDNFEIAVLNHTLPQSTRAHYAALIKQRDPRKLVLVLHASGARGNKHVDAAVDSRREPKRIVQTLDHLRLMMAIRDHEHEELKGRYVVVVDHDRHYTFVTDPVCSLLGFDRAELIGRQIEEISHGKSEAEVEAQFEQFVSEGSMEGDFVLRHRSGKPIPIHYVARVQPDGCLMAVWQPLAETGRKTEPS
jgi:PAS domain S-box-containing protein